MLIMTCLCLHSNSFIQIYDYACSLDEEVVHSFRDTFRFDMLCKVVIFASIAMEQGKRPVYCYTIPSLCSSHLEPISCIAL